VRIAYNLFTQNAGHEREDFARWAELVRPGQGSAMYRHNGAGEMLVFSAADFEDSREPRPDLPPRMEGELDAVFRLLVDNRWPFRIHGTYDESISRFLDVFERVNRETPFDGLRFNIDHAETISEASIERIAALGGGIAIQHRMAYQGDWFAERYGAAAAALAVAGPLLGARLRLTDAANAPDLAPSAHWPHPIVSGAAQAEEGPVMVTIRYRVASANRAAFLQAMAELRSARRRGGATASGLFEDAARPGELMEWFMEAGWAHHLRHHHRVTEAGCAVQEAMLVLHEGEAPPIVTHWLGAVAAPPAGPGPSM
jgi:hypothetical protein